MDERLRSEIRDLLRQDRTIDAIQRLRDATGLGLREAMDEVERMQAEADAPPPSAAHLRADPGGDRGEVPDGVPDEVRRLALAGEKIQAIRLLREQTGRGLKESKEAVERIPGVPRGGGGCLGVVVAAAGLAASLAALA